MTTEIIWTALPNGRADNRLHLSVHVGFRLTPDGTLADHSSLVNWPPPDLSLEVVFGATPPGFEAHVVSVSEPGLWSKLFPSSSPVAGFQFQDRSQLPIHTYPITKLASFLQDRYTKVAVDSPEDFPAIVDLQGDGFEQIDFSGDDGTERWNRASFYLEELLSNPGVVDTRLALSQQVDNPDVTDPTFDFAQLRDFHSPVPLPDDDAVDDLTQPVLLPEVDFHGAVQFCNQHPPLMRLLGLVFDVIIDFGGAPAPAGPTTVQVIPDSEAFAGVVLRTPETHCELSSTSFEAIPRPTAGHLDGGFLRFDDASQYEVIPVEADGGGIKAVDFAGNLGRKQDHPTEDTLEDSPVPTLRSDGFAVARLGHARGLKDRLTTLASLNSDLGADQLALYAEDLVRGYRVDVWDSRSQQWHSLMERQGQYEFEGGDTVIPVSDEGFLVTSGTKKPLSDDLYMSEEVFWWDGWSLVAPRPGKTLNPDPQAEDPVIDRPPNMPGPDFDLRIHFDAAPGTLPRLRYGVAYRFRARTVDLAGNSLARDTSDDSRATAPLAYGRFQPPQTPPVLLRTPTGPGESMETIVVRSNQFDAATTDVAQRHLAPAKIGLLTVEEHGLLDVAHGGQVVLDGSQAVYDLLAALDAAGLPTEPTGPDGVPYYDVANLEVDYAPDPAVRKVALRLLDGPQAGHRDAYPFLPSDNATWPDFEAIRLEVVEGTGAPSFADRVLTVPLEKGDVVRARLSPVLDSGSLTEFGLWHWILAVTNTTQQTALKQLVGEGQHWMFEPFRILTLVHAVRQPLATPDLAASPSTSRDRGNTFATVAGSVIFSRKSTSKIDFLASWEDPVDEGPESPSLPADVGEKGSREVVDQTAFTLDIDQTGHPTHLEFSRRHEFGDTKHHEVTYRGVATTRFGEFFTERQETTFAGPNSEVALQTGNLGVVPGSVKVTHSLGDGTSRPLIEGRDYDVDTDQGKVTFGDASEGTLPPDGANLVIVYLVPPVSRETTEPKLVTIPNSARPAAPKVVYALPTFGWESDQIVEGDEVIGFTSTRHGRGLRLYLERPWWSSGVGELLGVITWPSAEQSSPPEELGDSPGAQEDPRRPYVTQWGEDPIFESHHLPRRYPRLSSFPGAVATDTNLALAELGLPTSHPVNVAGHPVSFDKGRDLWFCDIDVEQGRAYTPFIRLAVARYQPDSIVQTQADVRLSPVVLADFLQLAPDRFATIVFDDAVDTILGVTLTGPSHLSTEASGGQPDPGTAQVIIEKRRPNVSGELGWQQIGPPIQMKADVVGNHAQWHAEVHLPGSRTPDTWRLVIEQFESLGAEPEEKPATPNPFMRTIPEPAPRLIHTDIIQV